MVYFQIVILELIWGIAQRSVLGIFSRNFVFNSWRYPGRKSFSLFQPPDATSSLNKSIKIVFSYFFHVLRVLFALTFFPLSTGIVLLWQLLSITTNTYQNYELINNNKYQCLKIIEWWYSMLAHNYSVRNTNTTTFKNQ